MSLVKYWENLLVFILKQMKVDSGTVNIWNMDFYMKFWKPGEQEFLFFALISSGSVLEVFEAQNHGNFPLAAFMQQPSTRHVKKEKKIRK